MRLKLQTGKQRLHIILLDRKICRQPPKTELYELIKNFLTTAPAMKMLETGR